ncbi:MAG: SDR family oxidoreductase, partial [Mycolicibacterium sp.]|nr:SDR family oxidoreductase [Mycolicibacterium sp.]
MAKNINLTGKIAVITGAGSGIGAATAQLLAQHGAKVHVADINADAAAAVASEIGSGATDHKVDVSRPEEVEALAKAVYDADGRVDILHNNAGIGHGGGIEDTTVEDWQRVIGVNLLGVAYGVQAFVPRMLKQGRGASVINTASLAGINPAAKMVPYCTSKFGVVGMTESLNAELSKRGIHFSAICPGIIDTNIIPTATVRGDLEG